MVGKRVVRPNGEEPSYLRRDLEEGRPAKDRKYRFRDQDTLDPDDQRRVEFKRKLLDAVESSDLEKFRKSDDEVRPLQHLRGRNGERQEGRW
jgi:hypothetical protein